MLEIIDIIFLIFAFVTLFFSILFLVLYLEQRKNKIPLEKEIFPSVSIVMPALNEEKSIVQTIRAVKNLDYPNISEIIVVDDGSTDRTGDLARAEGVTVWRKENQGRKSYPMNYALERVKGEIMACVDADSYPEPDSLRKAIQFFQYDKVAAVTTSVFVKNPKSWIERLQNIEYVLIIWARKMLEVIDSIYVTPGALSLYKIETLKKLGGFDNTNITEDIEIAWRCLDNGYKIKMSLESRVETGIPSGFRDWWRQRIRWNIGGMQTTMKYFSKIFTKKGMLQFVVPFFIFSYSFSIVGFFIFLYVIFERVYETLFYAVTSLISGTFPIRRDILDPILLPNIFLIFGLVIIFLAVLWIVLSYRGTNRKLKGLGELFDLIVYLSFYITVFPIVLLQSTWKLLRNKIEW